MKIPKYIKVGGQRITILRDEIAGGYDGDYGWTKNDENIIYVSKNLPPTREAEVFLHEILHMINGYLTEKECDYLSGALYQVIKDNKLNFYD